MQTAQPTDAGKKEACCFSKKIQFEMKTIIDSISYPYNMSTTDGKLYSSRMMKNNLFLLKRKTLQRLVVMLKKTLLL